MPIFSRLTAALLIIPAMAWSQPSLATEVEGGRYTMHESNDGFLRLDTQTGMIAHCKQNSGAWSCTPVQSNASLSQEKITQLEERNAKLQKTVKQLSDLLAENGIDSNIANSPDAAIQGFQLPSEEEVDKALDYFENMLRKFQDRLKKLDPEKPQDEDKAL